MGLSLSDELVLRERIMERLALLRDQAGGTVTRTQLENFEIDGARLPLVDRNRGIRNPRELHATLSILSKPDGQYDDRQVDQGYYVYSYRVGSAEGDNRKLRAGIEPSLPMILLRWLQPSLFVPIFPVFVVADDPTARQFLIALDESLRWIDHSQSLSEDVRRYAEQVTRRRLHQPVFRASVIRAYETRCAVCHLQHGELLDAAHIVPDSHEAGVPHVSNGLSLCKIHHAAYDQNLMGIRPDNVVEINKNLLEERDGPMLKYGLQQMHGTTITLPRRKLERPNPEALATRYAQFKAS
jgi:putative restriction endonuclease